MSQQRTLSAFFGKPQAAPKSPQPKAEPKKEDKKAEEKVESKKRQLEEDEVEEELKVELEEPQKAEGSRKRLRKLSETKKEEEKEEEMAADLELEDEEEKEKAKSPVKAPKEEKKEEKVEKKAPKKKAAAKEEKGEEEKKEKKAKAPRKKDEEMKAKEDKMDLEEKPAEKEEKKAPKRKREEMEKEEKKEEKKEDKKEEQKEQEKMEEKKEEVKEEKKIEEKKEETPASPQKKAKLSQDSKPVSPFFAPRAVKKEEKKEEEKEEKKEEKEEKKGGAAAWATFFSKKAEAEEAAENKEDPIAVATKVYAKYDLTQHTLTDWKPSWKQGESIPYLALANAFEQVSNTRSRIEQTQIMRDFFRSAVLLTPEDVVLCIYLSTNLLAATYEGLELGVGESLIQKAIMEATGKSMATIKKEYDSLGDLGLVAQGSATGVRTLVAPKKLTVRAVHKTFLEIARESGASSQKRRTDKIRGLLVNARECEPNFIVKALQGKMRINMGPKTVMAALGHAFAFIEAGKKKPTEQRLGEAADLVEKAYNQLPDWERIMEVLITDGIDELVNKVQLTVGVPFAPMLAHPTKGVDEIFDRLEGKAFTAEWKYDGERTQIHMKEGGEMFIFSRNLDNTTEKFPDIVAHLKDAAKEGVTSCILDCEAVAFDRTEQKILPFQILSTRSRKQVRIEDIKVNLCLFAFDLVYLNGKSLVHEPLIKRRQLLHENFQVVDGFFQFATYKDLSEPEEILDFLQQSVVGNCEGLMVKTLEIDAEYQAAKRSYQWLKVKKDYLDGVGDTIDLVPIGAWLGKGKRTGVYGGFLLACYDPDAESFQSISKIGTGFSDEQLKEFTEQLKPNQIPKPKSYFQFGDQKKDIPDVWLEPSVVWEVKCADLSISPVHQAGVGRVHDSKGIALRFPRLVRVRTDKSPEQATTAEQVVEMYRNQKINHTIAD